MISVDGTTLKRFIRIAKPFFTGEVKVRAILLVLLLISFSATITWVSYRLSYIGNDFITALSVRNQPEFWRHFYRYMVAFILATPVAVFYRYTEERYALFWREWLTKKVIQRYFSYKAYYKLNNDDRIDNPDQRIAEDIRSFTSQSLSFFLILLNSIISITMFMWVLWSISFNLVIAVLGSAIFASSVTYFLGRPLIGLNFAQLKKEADFRYKLINVRDNAESIAFYKGEKTESKRTRQKLQKALRNLRSIVDWNRNLSFFTSWYNYVIPIVPTILVAPLYLNREIEFGTVTQAGAAFMTVLNGLSIIVIHFSGLSAFAAVITRLGSFLEVLETYENIAREGEIANSKEGQALTVKNVTLYTPRRERIVVKDLTFTLNAGESLLITGGSGTGKSSLLRLFSGLWNTTIGEITRFPAENSIFVPQRPYMVLGTFRSQFLYARRGHVATDSEIKEVLNLVGLDGALERIGGFDSELDWSSILSTGEQQRVAFARVLLSNSKFVFLDEATTALTTRNETMLYNLLLSKGKTIVSVGHRETLEKFHHKVLVHDGPGDWKFIAAKRE